MDSIKLTPDQIERYSRQIILKEIGAKGMVTLLNSTVTIVGSGGLGCPATQMLAGMGIGNIRIIDGDVVDLTNLPRQILHYTNDIGKYKVDSIKEKVTAMNPDVNLEIHKVFINKGNVVELLKGSDFVIEASDNVGVKFLINDACVHLGIPFSVAGVVKFYGQLVSVEPGKTTCYRCIFRNVVQPTDSMTCSGAGVIGTTPTFAGNLQANEAAKSILGLKSTFKNGLFAFDLLEGTFDFVNVQRNKNCKTCSDPKIPYYKDADYGSLLDACVNEE